MPPKITVSRSTNPAASALQSPELFARAAILHASERRRWHNTGTPRLEQNSVLRMGGRLIDRAKRAAGWASAA